MKKLLTVLMATALFAGMTTVNAMSESELQSKLTATYTVSGEQVSLSSSHKALVKRYFNKFDVSETDADYIAERIDKAVEIVNNSGEKATSFKNLSKATRQKLKALVAEINANTSVKATTTESAVIIYGENGKVFAKVSSLVKQTGANYTVAIVASIITILGAALVLVEAKRAN
jgi:hypothetical protein